MPKPLKFLVAALLLTLLVALGTEVIALHRPAARPPAAPVIVRKSTVAPAPRKTVHPVSQRRG